jgi:outer membrane receptor protein involved in Fe transport
MRFGFEIKRLDSTYEYVSAAYTDVMGNPVPEARKTIDTGAAKFAAFAEYSLTLFSRLTFNLGLRSDYFTYNKHAHVSPRTSVTCRLSEKTSLSASAGIFHQNPSLLLLYQNEANKDLNDPMVYQYSLGLNHLVNDNTRLTIEAYYKSYHHFPINPTQPSLCLLDDLFGGSMFGDIPFVDNGKARSYGIELVLQKKLKQKIYGMISGSLFRTQYRDLEGIWRSRVFDNQYIFSVQGGYKPNKKWDFSLRWIIAGGMPYTPFDLETSEALNTGIFDTTRINAERMPAYHSLNLRFDRRYYFSGSNLTFYFSVWNAYNRKNAASYYWNEIKNKPDFMYQFNLLPVIGLEYEF